jgi:hypothetical protein
LCLKTFSYLARTQSVVLASKQIDELCQAVELGVFLNRCFDGKTRFERKRYRTLRHGLPTQPTRTYLTALRLLEQNRPCPKDWLSVYQYRRGVLQVSLRFLFELAELRVRPTLLPLCSQIQLIDDILDKRLDSSLGLPTFATARGADSSALANKFWRELRDSKDPDELPIVAGGWLVYLLARLVILCCPD